MATTIKNSAKNSVNSKMSALKSIREANKETKSLSGVIKTIRAFWKDGYKEAFEYIGLTYQDIEFKNIVTLWAKSYWNEDNTKMLYPAKVAKKDENGNFVLNNGKKVYEKVMKEYNQNFTVMRVFDALLQGKIERGELKL